MADLKTKPTTQSVPAFLTAIPDPVRRKDCRTVAKILRKATGEKAVMWGTSIVGFGSYHYKYASGREGDFFLTGFSPRKQNLTLYIMSGFTGYKALMRKLGKHSTGKSCLYIKRLEDVDLDVLTELIEQSVEHMKSRRS
ncbi:MAG: DUF1801 domain-containing protein [Gemmatimonadales bacterium]|nr:MAG: DUF1801 domain-containing protein [Gemmatimonadales bacterium]